MAIDADTDPSQGTLFAGRYRLQDPLPQTPDGSARGQHWHGFDEVLARPVKIIVLHTSGDEADELLTAAVANGRVAHPGIASVFDAAIVDGATYVVTEWVTGTTLTAALHEGPMPAPQAAAVLREAAEAVAAVHAQGLSHGNLHPDNIVLTTDGGIKLTNLRTNGGGDPAADVCCLGALLYASLTGKWPSDIMGSVVAGLPEAPFDDNQLCAPRQVLAGVPGHLSDLAMRAMSAQSALSATQLAQSLDHHATAAVTGAPIDQAGATAGRGERGRLRRIGIPVGILLVIALAGLLLGVRLGAIDDPRGYPPADGAAGKPSSAPVDTPRLLTISGAQIIDPDGDGTELNGADRVSDGDPSTAWRTDHYKSAQFGHLKKGMGVRLDLGTAQSVREVTVTVQDAGGEVQLRAGDAPSDTPDAYRIVTDQSPTSTTITFTITPTTARYWLIWYTSLPQTSGGYGVAVSEVHFS